MHSAGRMNEPSPSAPQTPRSEPRTYGRPPGYTPVPPMPRQSAPRQTYNQPPRQGPVYNRPPQQGPVYNRPPQQGPAGPGVNAGGGGMGCGTGCSFAIIAVIVLFVIGVIGFSMMGPGSGSNKASAPRTAMQSTAGSITKSTVKRQKLDKKYTTSTAFFVDELNWIKDANYLNSGLKEFYDKTGVHPLLYITDTVNGTKAPTEADMTKYADQLYSRLCPDEGHMLLLFHCLDESEDYSMWYTCGAQAKTVMDNEACNILMDYIDSYFYTEKTESEMFADAYKMAAHRIMTKTTSPVVYVVIFAGIIGILLVLFMWWKKRKEQKALEDQRTQEILNTELKTYAEQESATSDENLEELEKKYSDS